MKASWLGLIALVIICEAPVGNPIPCPFQVVYGPSTVAQRTAYVWNEVDVDGTYPSSPLCLDASYNMVRRRCRDGVWSPKYVSNCYNFECPKHFFGFDWDSCLYEFPKDEVCPDLGSLFAARHQSGPPLVNSTGDPIFCEYRTEEFLNASTGGASRINVMLTFVRKLHLSVYFPEAIESVHGRDAVYCYSGHVDTQLKFNRQPVGLTRRYRSKFTDGHTTNYSVYEVELVGDEPSEYWCQLYEIGQVRPTATEKVIAHKGERGNEYSLRVALRDNNGAPSLIPELCGACRLMEISSFSTGPAEYVLHLTGGPIDDVVAQFLQLKSNLESRLGEGVEMLSFRSSDFCLPQGAWKLTPVNSVAVHETCLDSKGDHLTRFCGGGFMYGAEWESEGPCVGREQPPEATKLLSEITSRRSVDFGSLSDVVHAPHNFTSLDVALMADGFKRTRPNSTVDFLRSVNKVMGLDKTTLTTAQERYNAMDKMLDAIDNVLLVGNPTPLEPVMEENLNVVTLRPFKLGDERVGAAFYRGNRVRRITSVSDLPLVNLEAVVVVSPGLLEALVVNRSRAEKEDLQVVITAFGNDHLFLGADATRRAGSKIISVVIPDFGGYLPAPIDLYLRPVLRSAGMDCGFWNYGGGKRGTWSKTGGNFKGMFKDEMVHCSFTHLTHFALVVRGDENVTWTDERKSAGGPRIRSRESHLIVAVVLLFTMFNKKI